MSLLSRIRVGRPTETGPHPAPHLEHFVADVGTGYASNWTCVLRRTVLDPSHPAWYRPALERVRVVAARPEHAHYVAEAKMRACQAADHVIRVAMDEVSRRDPAAAVTEDLRVDSCLFFTGWAATALALDGYISLDDESALVFPFADVIGMAGHHWRVGDNSDS